MNLTIINLYCFAFTNKYSVFSSFGSVFASNFHTYALFQCDIYFVYFLFPKSSQIGIVTGGALAVILGASYGYFVNLFTNDSAVLQIVKAGTLVCTNFLSLAHN